MPSETERITNAFLDRHDFNKLTERLRRAYFARMGIRYEPENRPLFGNTGRIEAVMAAEECAANLTSVS